jgi:hypothetical protein
LSPVWSIFVLFSYYRFARELNCWSATTDWRGCWLSFSNAHLQAILSYLWGMGELSSELSLLQLPGQLSFDYIADLYYSSWLKFQARFKQIQVRRSSFVSISKILICTFQFQLLIFSFTSQKFWKHVTGKRNIIVLLLFSLICLCIWRRWNSIGANPCDFRFPIAETPQTSHDR